MPFRPHSRCSLALLALLSVAANAGVATQPAEPSRLHYSGRVDISPASGLVEADLQVTGLVVTRDQEEIGFLLNAGLEVELVEGAHVVAFDTAPMSPESDWNRIAVRLARDLSATSIDIRFVYSGTPTMPENGINRITPDWVELGFDSAWHPALETVDHEFTADLDISLPPGWTVVASGDVALQDGRYHLDSRVPLVDIAFVAAPNLTKIGDAGFEFYYRDSSEETRTAVLSSAAACRDALNARFSTGTDLPTSRFVLTDRAEGGYARKNYIALTDVSHYSAPRLTEFLCHELAHFWSSGAKPLTVDNWLNEGFAVFVAAEITQELHGEDTFKTLTEDWSQRSANQPSIWRPDDLSRRPYEVNYKKAPLALLRLREKIGPIAFDTWLTRYMTEPINDTPKLLSALEEQSGVVARKWFERTLAE